MKITHINEPKINGVKIVNFERFMDQRGYFTETYRSSDFINNDLKLFPNGIMQSNESFSQGTDHYPSGGWFQVA
jgi:dTDP-4-dehydrorhamnose 3,5-epimerase-like enzyme